ncbi:MAG: EamA family transporter [Bacteroidota bacterium]
MWIIYALSAAVLWGMTYTLDEQIYKYISIPTSLAFASFFAFIAMFVWSYFSGSLNQDISTIISSKKAFVFVLFGVLTFIAAELMIGFSIRSKNATLASIIEISYPLFIALFSYLLFNEQRLNLTLIIGGVLIFTGVTIIYVFNR